MRYLFVALTAGMLFIGCGYSGSSSNKVESTATGESTTEQVIPARESRPFTDAIEKAHGAEEWLSHDAIEFELALRFGDYTLLAKVLMKTDFSRIKIINDKQEALVYDGEYVYASPADAEWSTPRFTIFTYPYFMAAPFKLNDPGSKLEPKGQAELNEEACTTAKLTFEQGIGDSPDDWYYLYRSDSSNLLVGMGYIVTYFDKTREEAEQSPSAITYHTFAEFEGMTLPTEWRFWKWSEETGLQERRGTARVGKYRFVKTDKFSFSIPFSYRKFNEKGEEVK